MSKNKKEKNFSEKNKNIDEDEKIEKNIENKEKLNNDKNNKITENYEAEEEEEDEEEFEERRKQEEKQLDKMYKKKLETLKKQCCKDLKILNEKLDKSQKNKKGYYELFIIENDINLQLELIKKNIKNDGEKNLYKEMKRDFQNLKKELAEMRGEE